MICVRRLSAVLLSAAIALPAAAQGTGPDANQQEARAILAELIGINTTESSGSTARAANAMATRLRAAGIPAADVLVIGETPKLTNLVVRYRGRATGRKPIMLLAHLDVVEARREDWSADPFVFREADGWYYGRGTSDNKAGAAMLVANLIRWKRERWTPDRDVIAVFTADEETTGSSIAWLLAKQRPLIDAEFVLNTDAGGGTLQQGKPIVFGVQASEKVYLSFWLTVTNPGGHSSVPRTDNAIYQLSAALTRLSAFVFPLRLNEVTRAYFRQSAANETGQVAADMRAVSGDVPDAAAAARLSALQPFYNSVLHTTCVATRLEGGHADNALPQMARAMVNCRMEPDDPADSVRATLQRVVADPQVKITPVADAKPSPPSPLRPEVISPIESLVREMWPGAVVVPEMSTGATDGLFARNAGIPVYGVSALFEEQDEPSRAHGRDERVGVKAFRDATEFWYRLVKAMASASVTQ